jgi:hypothetical protein
MIGMATAMAVAMGSLFGFLSLLAILVFLWKVYSRGGSTGLTAASHAIRDARQLILPARSSPGRRVKPSTLRPVMWTRKRGL